MNDFLDAAMAEERRLAEQLASNPLFRQLELVREVIRSYHEPSVLPVTPAFVGTKEILPRERLPRRGSMAAQVVQATEDYLREKGKRAQSGEIEQALAKRGIKLAGTKPTAVLSSYLSNSNLFDNVRGEGYGLTAWKFGGVSATGAAAGQTAPTTPMGALRAGNTEQEKTAPPVEEDAVP